MNIKEIDKWLDNEYGVSYTRLEELHDFVVEQDLKHREEKDKEIERLNNTINKAIEKIYDIRQSTFSKYNSNEWNNCLSFNDDILPLLNILKGEDKE